MTVSVKKEEVYTNQLYKHSGKYTITLPVTSKFSAFTDIQYHESYDLGDMSMADTLFNNNIKNIPDDGKHSNMLKNHIIVRLGRMNVVQLQLMTGWTILLMLYQLPSPSVRE